MKINKIIIGEEVKLDLTQDTATESDVMIGKTFHKSDGTQGTGAKAEPAMVPLTVTKNGTYEGVINQTTTIPLADNPELYITNPETAINYFPVTGFTCESKEDLKTLKFVIHGTDDNVYGDEDIWGEETENGVLYTYATSDGTYTSVVFNEETIAIVCHQDGSQEGAGLPEATLNTLYLMRDKVFISDFTANAELTRIEQVSVDGYSTVTVEVSGGGNIQPITITKNGVYEGVQVGLREFDFTSVVTPNTIQDFTQLIMNGDISLVVAADGAYVTYKAVDIAIPDNLSELSNGSYYYEVMGDSLNFSSFSEWSTDLGAIVPNDASSNNSAMLFLVYFPMVTNGQVFSETFVGTLGGAPMSRQEIVSKFSTFGVTEENLPDAYLGAFETGKAYIIQHLVVLGTEPDYTDFKTQQSMLVKGCLPFNASPIDGYLPVTVNIPDPPLEEKIITTNGTYAPSDGIYGISSVEVNVPIDAYKDSVSGIYLLEENEVPEKKYFQWSKLKRVDGEDNSSILKIGQQSFRSCSNLEFISLPNNLTRIEWGAFYDCKKLTLTSLPSTIIYIGENAFTNCSNLALTSLPDGVTNIGQSAFFECTNLALTSLPEGIIGIGSHAFSGCTNLALTSLPSKLTYIEAYCFNDCTNLALTSLPDGVTGIGQNAFERCKNLINITIPGATTSIGKNAFSSCSGLTSITIPDSVTSIGQNAFSSCSGLTSITIPAGVTSIANSVFSSCSSLTSITIPDSVTSIGISSFYNCTGLTSITIPNTVTSIGNGAFHNCSGLTSITIPDAVTSIGARAFYNCSSLTGAIIGNGVTGIPESAFEGCSSLASIDIPNGVTSIGQKAFYNCTGLTDITLPDGVTSIGDSAFYNCTGLQKLYITDIAAWVGIQFENYSSNPVYYASEFYLNDELMSHIELPDTVTKINDYAFYGCDCLTSITIPDSVTSIGQSAFSNCSNLTSITIPDSVTSIGISSFYNCTGLTSITIPNTVTSIGNGAFHNCSGLTSITIPDAVTSIGARAFYNCSSLTAVYINDITAWLNISFISYNSNPLYYAKNLYLSGELVTDLIIPSGVTNIGNYVFYKCTGLTSITIPDSVTSIGDSSFQSCTGLTSITIPDGVTSIGEYAFEGCSGLTSITIPDSVTSIGNYAFQGSGLTSITIPDSVTSIGGSAFYDCTGLTSATIPNSITSVSGSMFSGCSNLASVIIPNSVESIGVQAFYECSSLTSITIPDSVTSIERAAFRYCRNLKNVIMKPITPPAASNVIFDSTSSALTITVPYSEDHSILAAYQAATNWSTYASKIVEAPAPDETTEPETPTEEGTEGTEGTESTESTDTEA